MIDPGLFLFLASVSLTFSPFVADLHHRGEHLRLDLLYKQVTRWALTATVPVLALTGEEPRGGTANGHDACIAPSRVGP